MADRTQLKVFPTAQETRKKLKDSLGAGCSLSPWGNQFHISTAASVTGGLEAQHNFVFVAVSREPRELCNLVVDEMSHGP